MNWRTKLAGEVWDAIIDRYPEYEGDPGPLSDEAMEPLMRAAEAIADMQEIHPMFSEWIPWDEHLQRAVEEVHNKRQALRQMRPPEIKPGPVPLNMSMGNEAA